MRQRSAHHKVSAYHNIQRLFSTQTLSRSVFFANTPNTILGHTGFFEYRVNAAKAAHEEQEETYSMVKLHHFI